MNKSKGSPYESCNYGGRRGNQTAPDYMWYSKAVGAALLETGAGVHFGATGKAWLQSCNNDADVFG